MICWKIDVGMLNIGKNNYIYIFFLQGEAGESRFVDEWSVKDPTNLCKMAERRVFLLLWNRQAKNPK